MYITYFGIRIILKCTDNVSRLVSCAVREEREMFQIYESSKEPYVERQIGKRQCITAL